MRKGSIIIFIASLAILGCKSNNSNNSNNNTANDNIKTATIISAGLKFCEGTVAYGSTLLVSNFGTEELNPLNTKGEGYISKIDGNSTSPFIINDGYLSAPKGMAIANDYLYIADVGKIVVYNLKDKQQKPQVITMPDGNLYVNDIAISGQWAFISVTNTGKIFKLNISTPNALKPDMLSEYALVIGANGLEIDGDRMYVASYPPSGDTTADNVIYTITDINSTEPIVEKFITREGQYDGLAVYNGKLYFSSWVNGEVGYVDLKTKEIVLLDIKDVKMNGPADITILNDMLYIPNLPLSEIVVVSM